MEKAEAPHYQILWEMKREILAKEALKNFVKKAFSDLLENGDPNRIEEFADRYMAKDYMQHTDGSTLDFAAFVEHMKALKGALKSVQVVFDHIVAEGRSVSTVKYDGSEIEAKVIAYFEINEEGKFAYADEFSKILKGKKEDEDLGSRR